MPQRGDGTVELELVLHHIRERIGQVFRALGEEVPRDVVGREEGEEVEKVGGGQPGPVSRKLREMYISEAKNG